MDIAFARTFLAIVETGSFGKAAERLGLDRLTVRTQISEMEVLLEKKIFTDHETGLELT